MSEPTKIEPGSDLHFTALMAPDSLNLVVGEDRQALLRFARRVWEASAAELAQVKKELAALKGERHECAAGVEPCCPCLTAAMQACEKAEQELAHANNKYDACMFVRKALRLELDRAEQENARLRGLLAEWLDGMYDGPDFLRRVKIAVYGTLSEIHGRTASQEEG